MLLTSDNFLPHSPTLPIDETDNEEKREGLEGEEQVGLFGKKDERGSDRDGMLVVVVGEEKRIERRKQEEAIEKRISTFFL